MSVRPLESRLPAGFAAGDLGEAVVVTGDDGLPEYALVSSLTSPLSAGFEVDYVVFVLNGAAVDHYDWEIDVVGGDTVLTAITDEGHARYTPGAAGTLVVTVSVGLAAGGTARLTLVQDVRPALTGFEFLYERGGPDAQLDPGNAHATLAGDPVAMAEVFNGLRGYVLASSAGHGLPPRLLAALTYIGCAAAHKADRTPWDTWFPGRDQKLDWVAEELAGATGLVTDRDDPVGVCQLRMPRVATVVGSGGTAGAPYVAWREIAADGSDAGTVAAANWADYEALPADARTDLFNLSRFPKAQIELCAAMLARLRDRPHRYPGRSADDLVTDAYAVRTLAVELENGATLAASSAPGSQADEIELTSASQAVLNYTFLPQMMMSFADSLQDGAGDYGGHDLQLGDNDGSRRWGGVPASGPDDPPPGDHVRQLQLDLAELGFTVVGAPTGEFDRFTEWAVRELQVYATMRFLAIEAREDPRWVARLDQALNLYPYTGPICGVANLTTRVLVHLWKAKRWRCPVVVEAWATDVRTIGRLNTPELDEQPDEVLGNVWRFDETGFPDSPEFADEKVLRVRDFSGLYDVPPEHAQDLSDPDSLIDAGCCYPYGSAGGPMTRPPGIYYGNRLGYPSTWPEVEVLPELLVGAPLADLSTQKLATYRAVRAVSEVECLGLFDSVNCYDPAFVSVGPAHWTLALQKRGKVVDGELCAYLAYLHAFDPASSYRVFERFGVRINQRWVRPDGDATGVDLFDTGQRKFTGRVALQDENGDFPWRQLQVDDVNYFRTWHWHYRFVMAGRTIDGYRRRMWNMVRIRLRDILATPITPTLGIPDVGIPGQTRAATIGDCFTSEAATGMLLRWHINRPSDICKDGVTAPVLNDAITAAGLSGTSEPPDTWKNAEEEALITALMAQAPQGSDIQTTLKRILQWPNDKLRQYHQYILTGQARLNHDRSSFEFDDSGLPEAP